MASLALQAARPLRLPGTVRRMAFAVAGRTRAVPGLGSRLEAAYGSYFNRIGGQVRLFRGLFPDFASALRAIPANRLVGYDNEASADRVADERLRVIASDYPVMFWLLQLLLQLLQLLPHCHLLFDWGGNVGTSYYAYRKYLRYPHELSWLISDVPAVVRYGEKLARDEAAVGLRFSTGHDELEAADVLLAAGSLQFIEDHLAVLQRTARLPDHVLINKTPVYGREPAVTVQNIGSALCPYHLFNHERFVGGFEQLGYELVDEWRTPDCACRIPFYPEHSIAAFSGFYFFSTSAKRDADGGPALH